MSNTSNGGGSARINTGCPLPCFCHLAGVAVALVVSQGFSGSVHAILGSTTVALGVIQLLFGMLRGTHGGKYYNKADPEDPSTHHGDHYSRTTRRRIFEAYHKTAGYFTLFCAVGAIGSGLMQYPDA